MTDVDFITKLIRDGVSERVSLTERTMDASEFFNTVVKRNYQEFTGSSDDFRLLWNAIVSMNTVAEHVALEQLQYAQVSRRQVRALLHLMRAWRQD